MADLLNRLKSALADRYAIERELGRGGMATVYLAHDRRNDRKVALKLLHPELAAILGADRFLQEIKVTANLQHPHILPLFDSGQMDGLVFYVMPFVEGETLRRKLNRETQLPVNEGVRIATEVAGALDYAHRHGVIHRDIKPENILLHDGTALVADFGIALAAKAAGGERMTETGLSLGTPEYMSPEQAAGAREIDGRTDVYALGCVLYEMLVGEPPHSGPTAQAIIAKIITEKPPHVRAKRDTVPEHVNQAVAQALAKLPADRFGSGAHFAQALMRPNVTTEASPASPAAPVSAVPVRLKMGVAGAVAALGLIAIGAWLSTWLRPLSTPTALATRFPLRLAPDAPVARGLFQSIAVSPDGNRIVYVSDNRELYSRGMDQLEPVLIPGSLGAQGVFFSHDGRWLAFSLRGKLMKMPAGGGAALPTADIPLPYRGAAWGPNDSIAIATASRLLLVSAAGGTARELLVADTARAEGLCCPEFLPNGRGILFTARIGSAYRLAIFETKTGRVTRTDQVGSDPRFLSSGHVLLANQDGTLVLVPFDSKRLRLTGPPVQVTDGVAVGVGGEATLGVSRDGSIAYATRAGGFGRLVAVDRRGTNRDLGADVQVYNELRLAPDGRTIAFRSSGPAGGRGLSASTRADIWTFDFIRRSNARLTFNGARRPIWTPDGRQILYVEDEGWDIYRLPADGSSPPKPVLVAPEEQDPGDFTPDGRTLVYRHGGLSGSRRSLWFLQLDGPNAGIPQAFVQTDFDNHSPTLSPDGRWVAYASDESGRLEVYVRPFPGPGGKWQISLAGGGEPRWASSGREIFYRSGNTMMAAQVRTQPSFSVGSTVKLFEGEYSSSSNYRQYDVTPDGQSFFMVKPERESQDIVVMLNWLHKLTGR